MEITINKSHIIELYSVGPQNFIGHRDSILRLEAKKGDEIFYIFPRFFRQKYHKEDLYRVLFEFGELLNKDEALEYIRTHYNFKDCHLYESGNEIYVYPYVFIKMSDGTVHKKYFKTFDECEEWRLSFVKNDYNMVNIDL